MDAIKNFAKVVVSTGYDASATSVVLSAGEGSKLPAPATDGAFNLVWWNSTDYNDPSDDPNKEIVRCTARTTDTLTITRAQEGTSASTKNTSEKEYRMLLGITKKTMDDIRDDIDGSISTCSSIIILPHQCATALVSPLIDDNTKFYVAKYYVPIGIDATKISFQVSTTAESGKVKLAIYSEDGQTKHLEHLTDTIPDIGAAKQIITESLAETLSLSPGFYYCGIVTVGDAGIRPQSVKSLNYELNNDVTTEPFGIGYITTSAGTVPATFDPTSDITSSDDSCPQIRLDA